MPVTLRYRVVSESGLYIGTTFYPRDTVLNLTSAASRYLLQGGLIILASGQAPTPANPTDPTEDDVRIGITVLGTTTYVTLTRFLELFPSLKIPGQILKGRIDAIVAGASPTGNSLGKLEGRISSLEGQSAASDPTLITGTCAEQVLGLKAVRSASDGLKIASSTVIWHAPSVVGIATTTCEAGTSASVKISGIMNDPSWAFTPGPLWLGSGGALVSVPPSQGFVMRVATALTATKILIRIEEPFVLG